MALQKPRTGGPDHIQAKIIFDATDVWIKALERAVISGSEESYTNVYRARAAWHDTALRVEYICKEKEPCVEAAKILAQWANVKVAEAERRMSISVPPKVRMSNAKALVALTDALYQAEMEANQGSDKVQAAYAKLTDALHEQHAAQCHLANPNLRVSSIPIIVLDTSFLVNSQRERCALSGI